MGNTQSQNVEATNKQSDAATPSPSTEESITAYIERTLQNLDTQVPVVSFLPPGPLETEAASNHEASKESESVPLTKVLDTTGLGLSDEAE